jgi:hypothetical protein
MADKKFSQFTQITSPDPTTQLVGFKSTDNKRILISDLTQTVQLDTGGGYAYSAGQLHYDAVQGCVVADTGFTNITACVGQDLRIPFFNGTGSTITAGTPVSGSGSYVGGVPSAVESDGDVASHIPGFLGVAAQDVLNNAVGLATYHGAITGVDTSTLSEAPIYLASGGGITNTLPQYPTFRLLLGAVTVSDASNGVIGVTPAPVPRASASKSYFFQSAGVGAGTFWEAGFYDWASADANLTQASTTVTYGTVGTTYAAHPGIVPSGPGTVDTGVVGLRVTGTLDSETGTQTAAQTKIISNDITTLTANTLAETSDKFSGQVTFELFVVSGSPTTYSLDFNYGFSKYEDFNNNDYTLTGFEAKWIGGANDTGADIAIMHHKTAGWTYAATGFVAGNGDIARKSVDQAISGNISNGQDGAWERVGLDTFIDGNNGEGAIIQITTGAAGTFQTLDLHITAVSEEV